MATLVYSQNCVDLSNEAHSNLDRPFRNSSTKFEVIGYVVFAAARSSEQCSLIGRGRWRIGVGRRCLGIVAWFIEGIPLGRRAVLGGAGHPEISFDRDAVCGNDEIPLVGR